MIKTIEAIAQQFLPEKAKDYIRQIRKYLIKAKTKSISPLTEEMFRSILTNDLQLKSGDVVFIHSSINKLKINFAPYRILAIIREIIGEQGNMLFPTYPKLPSYKFLLSEEVFDVRNSPSYSGILTELARRQEGAIRSLHPTKSVCALGPLAKTLTESHQNSPYPYDDCSPYYKITHYQGVIIGLGVTTNILSFVHCVDDALKEEFPVAPYHKKCFEAKCINYEGETEIVKTYGHNLLKLNHNAPFISKYISDRACQDLKIYGRDFYRADTQMLFNEMFDLAKRNITVYRKISYKRRKLI